MKLKHHDLLIDLGCKVTTLKNNKINVSYNTFSENYDTTIVNILPCILEDLYNHAYKKGYFRMNHMSS